MNLEYGTWTWLIQEGYHLALDFFYDEKHVLDYYKIADSKSKNL